MASPLPFSTPAAFLSIAAAGGVFSSKENDLSWNTVTTAGTMSPTCEAVRALYSFTKPIMLTPCCPSAGPTGGAGVAFPASICSFTIALTFFAIYL